MMNIPCLALRIVSSLRAFLRPLGERTNSEEANANSALLCVAQGNLALRTGL